MRKIIFILFIVYFSFGCKTKTIVVENVRNTKDSIENVVLKQTLTEMEKVSQNALFKAQEAEQRISEYIERLNISESEKKSLKENIETTVKEYNEHGVLIKESYSKKTSELQSELQKLEDKNYILNTQLDYTLEKIDSLQKDTEHQSTQNTDLSKQIELLKEENSKLKSTKGVSRKLCK